MTVDEILKIVLDCFEKLVKDLKMILSKERTLGKRLTEIRYLNLCK